MSKHTTGKWRKCPPVQTERGKMWGINAFVDGTPHGFGFTQQDCRIAEVFSIEANADVIVQAPAMYALCEKWARVGDAEAQEILDAVSKGRKP